MTVIKDQLANVAAAREIKECRYINPTGTDLNDYRTMLDPATIAGKLNPGIDPSMIKVAEWDKNIIPRWEESSGDDITDVKVWNKLDIPAAAPIALIVYDTPPDDGEDATDDEHKIEVTSLSKTTTTLVTGIQALAATGGPRGIMLHGANHHFCTDKNGRLHVTIDIEITGGYSRNVHYYSDTGGSTWSSEWINTETDEYTVGTCLTIDDDNNLHFVWYTYNGSSQGDIWYRKQDSDGTWHDRENVTNNAATTQYDPVCRVDSNGIVHMAWAGTGWGSNPANGNIKFRKRQEGEGVPNAGLQRTCWSPELGIFVATADEGDHRAWTSPDGINWTGRTASAANTWYGVAWSPSLGLFAAVADSGTNRVMTSPDGINWTGRSCSDYSWNDICWSPDLGMFCAVAYDGHVMTSTNGTTWTNRTPASSNHWAGVCWSPELDIFVAVAITGSGDRAMTSPDGVNWTSRTTSDYQWISVCWAPDITLFCAVSWDGHVMTSSNGTTWTNRTAADAGLNWNSVCWSSTLDLFVAVAADWSTTNNIMTSPNGTTWTIRSNGGVANELDGVCWSPGLGMFVTVSDSGRADTVITSTNGTTWTPRPWGQIEAITDAALDHYYVSLDLDGNNYDYVLYNALNYNGAGKGAILHRKRTTSWQAAEEVSNHNSGANNVGPGNIVMDPDGYVHCIYISYIGASPQYMYRKRTTSWQTVEQLTNNAVGKSVGQIAVDKARTVHALYTRDYPSDTDPDELFYIYKTYGGSWTGEEKLTTETYEVTYPQIIFSNWPKTDQYWNMFQQGIAMVYIQCLEAYGVNCTAAIKYLPEGNPVIGSIEPDETVTIDTIRKKQRGHLCVSKINRPKVYPTRIG